MSMFVCKQHKACPGLVVMSYLIFLLQFTLMLIFIGFSCIA